MMGKHRPDLCRLSLLAKQRRIRRNETPEQRELRLRIGRIYLGKRKANATPEGEKSRIRKADLRAFDRRTQRNAMLELILASAQQRKTQGKEPYSNYESTTTSQQNRFCNSPQNLYHEVNDETELDAKEAESVSSFSFFSNSDFSIPKEEQTVADDDIVDIPPLKIEDETLLFHEDVYFDESGPNSRVHTSSPTAFSCIVGKENDSENEQIVESEKMDCLAELTQPLSQDIAEYKSR